MLFSDAPDDVLVWGTAANALFRGITTKVFFWGATTEAVFWTTTAEVLSWGATGGRVNDDKEKETLKKSIPPVLFKGAFFFGCFVAVAAAFCMLPETLPLFGAAMMWVAEEQSRQVKYSF